MIRVISTIIILICLTSCDQQQIPPIDDVHPMDRLKDNKAGDVVRNAIEYAGGWDTWEQKKNFSFYKNITQLDSTGTIIKNVQQLHQYNLDEKFQGRMTWSIGTDNYIIVNTGQESKKYKNGIEMTDDKSKKEAWNSSFGSNYVISMPFKLTDPGTILTYDGIDSTTLDQPVYSIKVEYEKGAGSSGGMHTWWYYFDIDSYDLVANYLDYGNGHSLTTYETFTEVDGIRLHLKRLSYASNEDKQRVLLRTIYENEEMKFDKKITSSTFKFI